MRLTVQYENEDGVKKGRVYGTSDTPTYKVRVTAAKRGHRPYLGRAYRKRFIEIEFTFDPPGEGQAREGFGSAIAEVAGGTITLPETRAKTLAKAILRVSETRRSWQRTVKELGNWVKRTAKAGAAMRRPRSRTRR